MSARAWFRREPRRRAWPVRLCDSGAAPAGGLAPRLAAALALLFAATTPPAAAQTPGDTAWIAEVEFRLHRVDSILDRARLAGASAQPDSARRLLRAAVWETVWALETAELSGLRIAGQAEAEDSAAVARLIQVRVAAAAAVTAVLDTVLLGTEWGDAILSELIAAYPASPVFERYRADLALAAGRVAEARAIYESLLRRHPHTPELHLAHAVALEAEGAVDQARDALARALELAPEDDGTFRALIRLSRDATELEALLERVRRLMLRRPDSRSVAEREIELLHRLGRPEEAAEAARRLRERWS